MSPNAPNNNSFLHEPAASDLAVSELLKKRRLELGQNLKEVENTTQIRKKYLLLIEAGDYKNLPDDVYALGYVKSYADHLGFDTAPILNLYKKERLAYATSTHIKDPSRASKQMSVSPVGKQSIVFSSRTILVGFIALLFITIVGYLGWQISGLTTAPTLSLNDNQSTVTTDFVIISGQADPDAEVFIDSSPILTNSDGSFSERVALIGGENQINVSAKNYLGKSVTVTKKITANLSSSASTTASVSPTPIDGVEVLLSIKNQATWVIVVADGQDVFRGTMLPNSSQIFKAKTSIKVTTGNAGNTQIVVTNKTVAGKDLGTVGKSQESKTDLEFMVDTQFQ